MKVRKKAGLSNVDMVVNDTFEKLRTKNKIKHVGRNVVIFIIVSAACIIFTILCFTVFFKVKTIEVEGLTYYDRQLIIDASGIEAEQNLFEFNTNAVAGAITDKYPYIKNVRIKRKLPSEVIICITEDSPSFYTQISQDYFVLSDTLRVLEYTTKVDDLNRFTDIVKLQFDYVLSAIIGREIVFKTDEYYFNVINIISTLRSSPIYEKINLIDFSDKFKLCATYDNRYRLIFGKADDLDIKLALAKEIIDSLGKNKNMIIDVQDIKLGFAVPIE